MESTAEGAIRKGLEPQWEEEEEKEEDEEEEETESYMDISDIEQKRQVSPKFAELSAIRSYAHHSHTLHLYLFMLCNRVCKRKGFILKVNMSRKLVCQGSKMMARN